MGKSTVIQALLAMIQEGKNPFRGQYIDIGRISELKNKYVGSKEIEITVNHKFVRNISQISVSRPYWGTGHGRNSIG